DRTTMGVTEADPTRWRFYDPCAGQRPAAIPAADWATLQTRARTIITTVINPAYQKHLDFYTREYRPHCARSDSVRDQPNGAAFYAFQVRQQTTTDLTPQQIHDIGLREVARIRTEMERVAREAGFPNREAFIQELRTNPRYYATTGE